jgi:hypothetical protein
MGTGEVTASHEGLRSNSARVNNEAGLCAGEAIAQRNVALVRVDIDGLHRVVHVPNHLVEGLRLPKGGYIRISSGDK